MSVEETPASLFVVSNLSWPEKRVDTRDPEEPELARLSQYASVSVIAFATFPVFNRLAGCCLVGSDLEVVCDRRLLQSSLDCLPSFLFGLVCSVFAPAVCSSSMWSYCTRLRRLLQCRGRLPHHWLSRVSVCFRSRRSRLLVVLCAGAALVLFSQSLSHSSLYRCSRSLALVLSNTIYCRISSAVTVPRDTRQAATLVAISCLLLSSPPFVVFTF